MTAIAAWIYTAPLADIDAHMADQDSVLKRYSLLFRRYEMQSEQR